MRAGGRFLRATVGALALVACGARQEPVGPGELGQAAASELGGIVERELADKRLRAISLAIVADGAIVWAAGFGLTDPLQDTEAGPDTVYRVGSISKLVTDLALMGLVERGEVGLDQPVASYLEDFRPRNPFDQAITLRQLMSHRAGLVREPPVGHYFDASEPSLAATVASLNRTELVYQPKTRQKYSNAGVSVVGRVLEVVTGEPFAVAARRAVLEPMGMTSSSFVLEDSARERLASAAMWSYDGREFEAPDFALGTSAAGNLYSTVTDLARFMIVLMADDPAAAGSPVGSAALARMAEVQFAEPDRQAGFGLGFHVSELDGRRTLGHGGAVYGFSTQLVWMPDENIGVVAATSMDVSNDVMRRITEHALRLMVAMRSRGPMPTWAPSDPVPAELARSLDGRFRSEDDGSIVELIERNGALFLRRGSTRVRVRTLGSALVSDGRVGHGVEIKATDGGAVEIDGKAHRRLPQERPEPAPADLRALVGEYGWDHNVLFVYEDRQQLNALIEWIYFYPLTRLDPDVFAFPDHGLYHGEKLHFDRDIRGRVTSVEAASVVFPRQPDPGGKTFRIQPQAPVAELRQAALRARPPAAKAKLAADLVDVATLEPGILLDIRYATDNNFMGAAFYPVARALLQRPVAEALVRVHRGLAAHGYGLLIHDAYRPWYVTKMFWDGTAQRYRGFVANPRNGSIHNRGGAVDLTLFELASGNVVEMVSGYDEFSPRSNPDYQGGTALQRYHRELLRDAMEAEGFRVNDVEWWHFDHRDARRYPILNIALEDVPAG